MPSHPAAWPGRAGLFPRLRHTQPVRLRLLTPLIAVVVVSACGGATIPVISFDPSTPCTSDGREPGAYPDLEALLPAEYDGHRPDNVDSGRNCTPGALGALAAAGIDGVRFAGATWSLGGTTGLTVAMFDGDGLDPATMLSFYVGGATTDRHTEKVATADTTVGGQPAHRLDVLASDGTGHTVVTWPGGAPGRVAVLLASDLGDAKVAAALDEFGGRGSGPTMVPSPSP